MPISNFMKIYPEGGESSHTDGRTDGQIDGQTDTHTHTHTHTQMGRRDEDNSSFLHFCEKEPKINIE